jgi:Tfp pilus assembly protein PilX
MNRERIVPVRHPRESGSAYVLTLLVLLVLTLLGLVLALITQSEVQVGANERMANRVFYAADMGIGEATTRLLFSTDNQARVYTIKDPGLPTSIRVEVSPFHPINDAPCNLCEINQGNDFYKVTHVVNVVATRFGDSGGEIVLAQKRLGVMIELDPIQQSTDTLRSIDDSGIQEIKF